MLTLFANLDAQSVFNPVNVFCTYKFQLFQRQYRNVASGTISESFIVDDSVGRNFVFRADYTQRSYIKEFAMRSPTGAVYNQLTFDDTAKVALFKLPMADVGRWSFTLRVAEASPNDAVAIQITTQTRSNTTAPITVECYVPDGIRIAHYFFPNM